MNDADILVFNEKNQKNVKRWTKFKSSELMTGGRTKCVNSRIKYMAHFPPWELLFCAGGQGITAIVSRKQLSPHVFSIL